jgi:hypothetical protein
MPPTRGIAVALTLLVILAASGVAVPQVADAPASEEPGAIGRTPPRLSFIDGQVSFWRPGAEEWVEARLNTALAASDELYTGSPGNLEVQIGTRAYVRAWASTQLGLASLEPDFVQLKVATGYLALDLRRLDPGHTVEVDTPNAAFTIEHAGYYRVNVTESRTSFVTRRGGRATVTPPQGTAAAVAPSEEVVVEGTDSAQVFTYVAPELDVWDRWNYARTDALIDSQSSRYVPPDVYGIDDLDHHGSWRVVETYGPVWVPTGVPADWVPYSTGSWTWDPYYGWTWVDAAPWGWAPYHYGRWVHVSGFWGWAPGPLVVRPVYAPALVAFVGPRVGISIGIAGPAVGWVALGWGEPVIPWWGPVGFIGGPRWVGWGGPRIVNNVVISRTTVVHVHEVNVYRNVGVRHAVTVVPRDRFGHGPVPRARVSVDSSHVEPMRGKLDIAPARASLVPDAVRGVRPPEAALRRPVVATRAPEDPARWLKAQGIPEPAKTPSAAPRLVPPPRRASGGDSPPRPPFGASKIERPQSAPPPRPQRAQPSTGGTRAPAQQPAAPTPSPRSTPSGPKPPATGTEPRTQAPSAPPEARGQVRPAPARPRVEPGPSAPASRAPSAASPTRPLPGEPANRLFPGRSPETSRRATSPSVGAPSVRPPAQERGAQPRSEPGPAGPRSPEPRR